MKGSDRDNVVRVKANTANFSLQTLNELLNCGPNKQSTNLLADPLALPGAALQTPLSIKSLIKS